MKIGGREDFFSGLCSSGNLKIRWKVHREACFYLLERQFSLPALSKVLMHIKRVAVFTVGSYIRRWGQPAKQQGRRMPPLSFERALAIRIFLVSAFLPDVTQQTHSFLASGVMSSHIVCAGFEETRALRKSAGSLCSFSFLAIAHILHHAGVSMLDFTLRLFLL